MAEVEIRVYGPEICGLCKGRGVLGGGKANWSGRRRTTTCGSCEGRGRLLGQVSLWVHHVRSRREGRYTEVWKAETWESLVP